MANPWDPTNPAMTTIMDALAQAEQAQGLEQPMMQAPGLQPQPFGVGYTPWLPSPGAGQADLYMHNQGLQAGSGGRFADPMWQEPGTRGLAHTFGVQPGTFMSYILQALGDQSPQINDQRMDQLMTLAGAASYQNQQGGWLHPLGGTSRALGAVSSGVQGALAGEKLPDMIAQQMREGSPEFGQSLVEDWGLPEWAGLLGEFAVLEPWDLANPAFIGVPLATYAARRASEIGASVASAATRAGADGVAAGAAAVARASEAFARFPAFGAGTADELTDSIQALFRDIDGMPVGTGSDAAGNSVRITTPHTNLDITVSNVTGLGSDTPRPVVSIDVLSASQNAPAGLGSEAARDLLMALDSQGIPSRLDAMPFGARTSRYGPEAAKDRSVALVRNVQMYEAIGYQVPVSRIPGSDPDVAPPTSMEVLALGLQQAGLPLPGELSAVPPGRALEILRNFTYPSSYDRGAFSLPMWRAPVTAEDGEARHLEMLARRGQPYMYEHGGSYAPVGRSPNALIEGDPENALIRQLAPDEESGALSQHQMWRGEWDAGETSNIPRDRDPGKAIRSREDLAAWDRYEQGTQPNPLGDIEAGLRPASLVEDQQDWMAIWRQGIVDDGVTPTRRLEVTQTALDRLEEQMGIYPNDDFGLILDELRGALPRLVDDADADNRVAVMLRDVESRLDNLDRAFASQVQSVFEQAYTASGAVDDLSARVGSWRRFVREPGVSPHARRLLTENMLKRLDESGGDAGLTEEVLNFIRAPKPDDTVDDVLWGWRLLRDRDADMSDVEIAGLAEEALGNLWSRRASFSDGELARATDEMLASVEALAQRGGTDEALAQALLEVQRRLAGIDPELGARVSEIIRIGRGAPLSRPADDFVARMSNDPSMAPGARPPGDGAGAYREIMTSPDYTERLRSQLDSLGADESTFQHLSSERFRNDFAEAAGWAGPNGNDAEWNGDTREFMQEYVDLFLHELTREGWMNRPLPDTPQKWRKLVFDWWGW